MKTYKFLISIVVVSIIFNSCSYKICNISLGRYINKNDQSVINYIDLAKDGTYVHYYRKDTVVLSQDGYWKKSKEDNCIIELENWKSFNEGGEKYEVYGIYLLYLQGDYLNNGPDGNTSTSFKKD